MVETHGRRSGFSLPESARLVGVSPQRLRNWVRLGILSPRRPNRPELEFDFPQVAFARRLNDTVRRGASMSAIRRRVERLRRWLPECSLAESARLEERGRLLIRVHDRLLDVTGQAYFEFASDDAAPVAFVAEKAARANADELFRAALACEDAGEFADAERLYLRAVEIEPHDAVLHFNLGNTRWEQNRCEDAIASYERSLELDSLHAEAWNNLGLSFGRLGDYPAAIKALERAVNVAPAYDAARRNLDLFRRLATVERPAPRLKLFSADAE